MSTMIANDTTITAAVNNATDESDIEQDAIGWGFGMMIPIAMPEGSTYGEALAVFEEFTTKINAYVASLTHNALPAEYTPLY